MEKGRQVVHPYPCCVGWSPGGCCSTALQYRAWAQVPFSSKGLSRSLARPLPSDLVLLTQKVTCLTPNYQIVLGLHPRGTGLCPSQQLWDADTRAPCCPRQVCSLYCEGFRFFPLNGTLQLGAEQAPEG